LSEKHRETFWIKATNHYENGTEQFRYDSVVHTKKPNAHLLGTLLEQSIITMDYTMHQEPTRTDNRGYLFKILFKNMELLFPNPVNYELSS